ATRRLVGVLPLADWRAGVVPDPAGWASLRGRPVTAAAGIAQPERFFAMLRDRGLEIAPLPLPDHHRFDPLPWPAGSADVIVTEKDAVKLLGRDLGGTRLWVAPLDLLPEPGFAAAVLHLLPKPPAR
ncbi:MAG: tetraacyldisaccharide 4'-kinase, partial [Aquincola sp.]|nr:tetraacyldisaccharide 4'-kinase [Aquincola sp.]